MRNIYWYKIKRLPFVTIVLAAVNIIVFALCHIWGDWFFENGVMDVYHVIGFKQYARIIYAMFLHANIEHIFGNMVVLIFLGQMIEEYLGHIPYAIAYFMAGIGGNLLSLYVKWIQQNPAGSLGASGAIFGLDGMLLAILMLGGMRRENISIQRVIFMIVFSIYSGYVGSNIDNAAHIGGLIVGYGVGLLFYSIKRKKRGRYFE